MRTLPTELLIEIFTNCCINDSLSPLTLRQVNWAWQNIVDESPRLWQTITLTDAHLGYKFTTRQALHWARLASPLKYDIQLNLEDLDCVLPLLAPLLPSVDRWSSLQLTGKREEGLHLHDLDLSPESLAHLHLSLHDSEVDEFDEDEDPPPRISFTSMYPDGESSRKYSMNVWLTAIPPSTSLPPLFFTHLTISEGGAMGIHTHPRQILEFLDACPNLQSFHLSGWPRDGPVDHNLPVVHLPNLTTLQLKSTCSVRALLSSLNTPKLEYLYLAHTNVDFQLRSDYNEEGDSDDEARDYSQSPWSDHATGMGLRRLIARCKPPVRVLEMDFCDMRTKDFRFVFDRLPTLQDFRIVGSDMSDKVINMLRPRQTQPEKDGTSATRLTVPRLRVLKLVNCQRLTGSAVVDALADRVKWTDEYTPASTLAEITIVGCDGFSAWDRHVLSGHLGQRLQSQI